MLRTYSKETGLVLYVVDLFSFIGHVYAFTRQGRKAESIWRNDGLLRSDFKPENTFGFFHLFHHKVPKVFYIRALASSQSSLTF